jgi:hypothetical protein
MRRTHVEKIEVVEAKWFELEAARQAELDAYAAMAHACMLHDDAMRALRDAERAYRVACAVADVDEELDG